MDDFSIAVESILDMKSLDWSPEADSIMQGFAKACRRPQMKYPELDESKRNEVRLRTAQLIYNKEVFWANSLIASENTTAVFEAYPTRQILQDSARRDIETIQNLISDLPAQPNVLVIGSGPLNITGMCYGEIGASVDNVDISPEAIGLSQGVRDALKVSDNSRFFASDAATVELPHATSSYYDIIHVAGMAGFEQEKKQAIVDNVLPKLKENGVFLMQDDNDPGGKYVFPEIDPEGIQGLTLISKSHHGENIFTSYFCQKKI